MAFIQPRASAISQAICRAVGVDPNSVLGIEYEHHHPGDFPVVRLTMHAADPATAELMTVTRWYKLTPLSEPEIEAAAGRVGEGNTP